VCSATATADVPGVLETWIPLFLHSSKSTLSKPTEKLQKNFAVGQASKTFSSNLSVKNEITPS